MNKRQKKKKIKYDILHMKPNDILFIKYAADVYDIQEIATVCEYVKKIVPPYCSFAAIPLNWEEVLYNKEDVICYISQLQNIVDNWEDK